MYNNYFWLYCEQYLQKYVLQEYWGMIKPH